MLEQDEEPSKRCYVCNSVKPLTEFYTARRYKDGKAKECKECGRAAKKKRSQKPEAKKAIREYNIRWRQENPEKYERGKKDVAARYWTLPPKTSPSQKQCSVCRCTKPSGDFYKNRLAKDGLAYQCKECAKVANQKRLEKPEAQAKKQATRKQYLQSAKGREQGRRDSINRRARKLSNGGSYTEGEWKELCSHYGNRCLACRRTDRPLTVDHVVPLIRGGSNEINNLQCLCKPCNCSKGTKQTDYRY